MHAAGPLPLCSLAVPPSSNQPTNPTPSPRHSISAPCRYAHWWIRQAVTRSISDQARVIRLPVHLHEAMGKVRAWPAVGVRRRCAGCCGVAGGAASCPRMGPPHEACPLCPLPPILPSNPPHTSRHAPPLSLSLARPQVRRAEQQLWDELGTPPSPQAVADRCGLTYPKLMNLYKSFRAPTSRDAGPLSGDASTEDKAPGEQWVEEMMEDVSSGVGWGGVWLWIEVQLPCWLHDVWLAACARQRKWVLAHHRMSKEDPSSEQPSEHSPKRCVSHPVFSPLQEDPAELAHHRMMKDDLNHVLLTLTERECGIIKVSTRLCLCVGTCACGLWGVWVPVWGAHACACPQQRWPPVPLQCAAE